MLEQSENWQRILKAVQTRQIREVAAEFGVRPGEITAALIRANVSRKAVPAPGVVPEATTERVGGAAPEPTPAAPAPARASAPAPAPAPAREAAQPALVAPTPAPARPAPAPAASAPAAPAPVEASDGEVQDGRRPSRIEPYRHLLTVHPDSHVARLAGVGINAVAAYRRRHGYAAYQGGPSPSRSADAGSAAQPARTVAPAVVAPVAVAPPAPAPTPAPAVVATPVPVAEAPVVAPAPEAPVAAAPVEAPASPAVETPVAAAPVAAAPVAAASVEPPAARPAVRVRGARVFTVTLVDGSIGYVVGSTWAEAARSLGDRDDAISMTVLGPLLG